MWDSINHHSSWYWPTNWQTWHKTSWRHTARLCQGLWQSSSQRTHKLRYYAITGPVLPWITALCSTRRFIFWLSLSMTSGVPQGTCLGSLLFLPYINDLPISTTNSSTFYFNLPKLKTTTLFQHDIDDLEQLKRSWEMFFRPNKCEILHYTRSHTLIHSTYSLHNQ